MKRWTLATSILAVSTFLAARPAQAQILYLTFQVPGTFAGTHFGFSDILKYDTVAKTSSIFLHATDIFAPGHLGGSIDALDVLADGTLLLSTSETAKIPSLGFFQRNDVVHFDPVTKAAEVVIDGAAHFTGAGAENIDVVDQLADGSYLLSTRNEAVFDGFHVKDGGDIFRYDPKTDSVSEFFDGSSLFKQQINIDAFEVLPDGRYLFSVFQENEVTLDGVKVNDADIAVYDGHGKVPVQLYLDHNDITDWKGKHRDIKGIAVPPEETPPPPVVPEPVSASLFGLGLAGLGITQRRRRQ